MWLGRAFVIAHLVFYTMPVALVFAMARGGSQLAPFVVMAPYVIIPLALQLFRCPSCRVRVYSLEHLHADGRWYKPSTPFSRCHSCGTSFWSGRKPEIDTTHP